MRVGCLFMARPGSAVEGLCRSALTAVLASAAWSDSAERSCVVENLPGAVPDHMNQGTVMVQNVSTY